MRSLCCLQYGNLFRTKWNKKNGWRYKTHTSIFIFFFFVRVKNPFFFLIEQTLYIFFFFKYKNKKKTICTVFQCAGLAVELRSELRLSVYCFKISCKTSNASWYMIILWSLHNGYEGTIDIIYKLQPPPQTLI